MRVKNDQSDKIEQFDIKWTFHLVTKIENWTKLSKLKNRTNKVFKSDLKKHDSMLPLLKTEKKFE